MLTRITGASTPLLVTLATYSVFLFCTISLKAPAGTVILYLAPRIGISYVVPKVTVTTLSLTATLFATIGISNLFLPSVLNRSIKVEFVGSIAKFNTYFVVVSLVKVLSLFKVAPFSPAV